MTNPRAELVVVVVFGKGDSITKTRRAQRGREEREEKGERRRLDLIDVGWGDESFC